MNNEKSKVQPGILKAMYDYSDGDDFICRFLYQMGKIRDCSYRREERISYDKSYHPVFQNLVEAQFAKRRCKELINNHINEINNGTEGIYHGNQIDIKTPIDDELNIYFKDFFIRGEIAIDCLMRHARFMKSGINFLFTDDPKKYREGVEKFPIREDDFRFQSILNMMKNHKQNWYLQFREVRRKIIHEGFALPHIEYKLNSQEKIEIILPVSEGGQSIIEMVEVIWKSLTDLCENILVFLLSLKLKDNMIIVYIPFDKRDKIMPIKYMVSLKEFPGVPLSCG